MTFALNWSILTTLGDPILLRSNYRQPLLLLVGVIIKRLN